jgi:hypothetical protein
MPLKASGSISRMNGFGDGSLYLHDVMDTRRIGGLLSFLVAEHFDSWNNLDRHNDRYFGVLWNQETRYRLGRLSSPPFHSPDLATKKQFNQYTTSYS